MGSPGNEGPLASPTHALPPGLAERLELEKKRSRQSLEDLERLRAKEVPVSEPLRPPAVPTVRPGPAEASVTWCPWSTPLAGLPLTALGCLAVPAQADNTRELWTRL